MHDIISQSFISQTLTIGTVALLERACRIRVAQNQALKHNCPQDLKFVVACTTNGIIHLHMSKEMLSAILGPGSAKVEADAPEGNDTLLRAVTSNWDTPDELETFAIVEFFAEGRELGSQGWKLKILLTHILQVLPGSQQIGLIDYDLIRKQGNDSQLCVGKAA